MEAQEKSSRPRITASMITALAAGIVSLSALSVSIYEAYLMREQQAASVLPIIDFWAAYNYGEGYSLNLANKGLGPAFIKHIGVDVDDSSSHTWNDVLVKMTGRQIAHNESALIGSVLAPGETGTMLAITGAEDGTEVWQQAQRVTLRVCYCSVFGDCWTTTVKELNTGKPRSEEITACASGDQVIF
jgi:hypothetical protein